MNTKTAAIEMKIKGLTYDEIGKKLGVSRQRAQQLVKPSAEIFTFVRKRAGGKCETCGIRLDSGHVHHIDSTEDYNDVTNLQYLCLSCHAKAHVGDWEKDLGPSTSPKLRVQLSAADHRLMVGLEKKLGIRWPYIVRMSLRFLAAKEGLTL